MSRTYFAVVTRKHQGEHWRSRCGFGFICVYPLGAGLCSSHSVARAMERRRLLSLTLCPEALARSGCRMSFSSHQTCLSPGGRSSFQFAIVEQPLRSLRLCGVNVDCRSNPPSPGRPASSFGLPRDKTAWPTRLRREDYGVAGKAGS